MEARGESRRTPVVAVGLVGLLVTSIAWRTYQGWSPTHVEARELLCRHGPGEVCFELATDYARGHGVPHDEESATDFFDLACDKLHVRGCEEAGRRYAEGLGAKKNLAKSVRCFERACDRGGAEGCAERGQRMLRAAETETAFREAERVLDWACRRESESACLALGEHLSTPAFDASRPGASADAFGIACRIGSPVGCRRLGQAEACARGVGRDLSHAFELWSVACDGGDVPGCLELLEFGARDQLNDLLGLTSMRAALKQRAYVEEDLGRRAQAADAVGALEAVDPKDGFAAVYRVSAALDADELDAAERLLAASGPEPEFTVLRSVARERRRGTPWPDALFAGWGQAGMPDLAASKALLQQKELTAADFLWCSPGNERPLADDPDRLLREFAGRFQDHRDDRRQTRDVLLEAALRHLDSPDEDVQLVSLALLRYSGLPAHGHEREIREALARAHPKSLYFQLLALVPRYDALQGPSPSELARLEAVSGLPFDPPSARLFQRLTRSLEAQGAFEARETVFLATADCLLGALDLPRLRAWLGTGVREPRRVAALERHLGESVAEGGWLVHLYQASFLVSAAGKLVSDDALTTRAMTLKDRADRVRFHDEVTLPVGQWPIRGARRAFEQALVEREVDTVERLTALSRKAAGR